MTPRTSDGRRLVALVIALAFAPALFAQGADHSLYTAALARERTMRASIDKAGDAQTFLRGVRSLVTDYQALVRRFPASGYSANALWQAGRLELDAYTWFGEISDREAGVRLLQRLAADYPASSLVKLVEPVLAGLSRQPSAARAVAPATSRPAAGLATVRGITRTVLPDVVRLVMDLDIEVPFRDERMADPDRLVIDFTRAQTIPALSEKTLKFPADSDVVRQARVGATQSRATRVVFDATGVATYSIYALYNPYRLVIDCVRGAPPAPPRPLASRPIRTAWASRLPSAAPRDAALLRDAPAGPPVTAADAVDRSGASGPSMARQLGLGVSRIVIDPGHGGHDPGATGQNITEAELVLDVALRLEKLLLKVPSVEVVLTRRTDDFVPLQERTAIANREGADLFLSIHANASESGEARGIETYFLNFANNLSAAAVATRENAASGQAMAALPDFVKAIALNNKLDESRDFAAYVQRSMVERLRPANKATKDLGVKQAPFVVLIGAAMPSVLAEVSFITNTQEAKLLRAPAYRQRIADALLVAIRKYQSSLRSQGTVARQSQ